ncbi:MAG TPA: hypothetical protein VGM37_03245 [Armatimonadota bacterium]|jgi:hypothetical protein
MRAHLLGVFGIGLSVAVTVPLLLSSSVRAAIPRTLSFEGILSSSATRAPKPDGVYLVTFRLFTNLAPTSGETALWTEANKPVTVSGGKGIFTTQIGTPTSFGSLAFDQPYFLEIQVTGEASAMTPRIPLSAAAYSLNVPSASLSLPFSGSASVASPGIAMSVRNSGSGVAIQGSSDNNGGVVGFSVNYDATSGFSTTGNGVRGGSTSNKGVFGSSTDGVGAQGSSTNNYGLYGNSTNGSGVYGSANGSAGGEGVYGTASGTGAGVHGHSASGFSAVYGEGAHNGVYGQTFSGSDSGVFGRSESTGVGVSGFSVAGPGLYGVTGADSQNGVFGYTAMNNGSGVSGRIDGTGGSGVFGYTASNGSIGAWGANDGDGPGVQGNSKASDGVIGFSASTIHAGVAGVNSGGGFGVYGQAGANGTGGYFTADPGGLALYANGECRVKVLNILGGADVAEKFDITDKAGPGTVVAIDSAHPGSLCVARGAYNRRVAGVLSGAGNLEAGMTLSAPDATGAQAVAMTGRVWVECNTSDGPIEPGDMLTTSDAPGRAMKVVDFTKAQGATIGKAMTALPSGEGIVLALVSLQ